MIAGSRPQRSNHESVSTNGIQELGRWCLGRSADGLAHRLDMATSQLVMRRHEQLVHNRTRLSLRRHSVVIWGAICCAARLLEHYTVHAFKV